MRVRAHALPSATAAVLEQSAALLRDLQDEQHMRQQQDWGHRSGQSQRQQQQVPSSLEGDRRRRDAARLVESYNASVAASGDKALPRLLQRAWLLGPRHVGPNIALASPSAMPVQSCAGPGTGLFDVPSSQVVRAAARLGGVTAPTGAEVAMGASELLPSAVPSSAGEGGNAMSTSQTGEVQQQQLDVPVGQPWVARMLCGSTADASAHKALAEADADAAAESAAVAASAGVSELWSHVCSSVQSGVTAGFQLASSAGPLCDEAMWGVAFELEVRLLLPPSGGATLDLAEGVYGPFSGQVRCVLVSLFFSWGRGLVAFWCVWGGRDGGLYGTLCHTQPDLT